MASLTSQLAELLERRIDQQDRQRAQHHLIDWLACALAGSVTEEGVALRRWADQFGGKGTYPTVHGTHRTREAALLVNGGVGNVLEMDDLHRTAILHPGPVVIPAALAVAQASGASGEQLLDAIVRGYEAMIRVGQSFGTKHYRFWHNTATAGPFGAAAAVASLLGADKMAMTFAFGHAGTQSAGLWQTRHEPSMSKQLHIGRAAHSGLIAAQFAVSGLPAPRYILEGEQGLYAAMCPDPIPELVVAQADAPWAIWDVSFKPWPACRHAHAGIDAALLAREKCDVNEIERVNVLTYDEAVRFCDQARPTTITQAKFSLQHSVAVCLLAGPPTLASFEASVYEDSTVRELAGRVDVEVDAQINSRFPHRYGASLMIVLRDGSTQRVDSPDALGDPNKPIDASRIQQKYDQLLQWAGVGEPIRADLYKAVSELVAAPTLTGFLTQFDFAGQATKE